MRDRQTRVEALRGVADARDREATALYRLASERLLCFCLDHRLEVVILLGRAEGSRYGDYAERTSKRLQPASTIV